MIGKQLVHEWHTMLDERIHVNSRTFKERSQNDPSRQFLGHNHQLVEDGYKDVPLIEKFEIVFVHSECQLTSEKVQLLENDAVVHWQVEPKNGQKIKTLELQLTRPSND
jgi:hypothetical protein